MGQQLVTKGGQVNFLLLPIFPLEKKMWTITVKIKAEEVIWCGVGTWS